MATFDLPQGAVKVWVNFDGTGTVAINDSLNVSSITDNGTGDYEVEFGITMGSTDYSVAVVCDDGDFSDIPISYESDSLNLRSTTTCTVWTIGVLGAGTNLDFPRVSVTILGDTAASGAHNIPEGAPKAWVIFGIGEGPFVSNSYNVDGLTWNATGQYEIDLLSSLTDANYALSVLPEDNGGTERTNMYEADQTNRSGSQCEVWMFGWDSFDFVDPAYGSVAFYGTMPAAATYDLPTAAAKAWAKWDGTGTLSLDDSYNVSSITDNATGNYTVNLSVTMSALDEYCVVGSADDAQGFNGPIFMETSTGGNGGGGRSTTTFDVRTIDLLGSGSEEDADAVCVHVYGDFA
jgi:hypothetical protein